MRFASAHRSRRRQAADRGVRYAEGPGDVGQCLASVTAGNGFTLLVWCQLAGPAHMNASGLRPGPAFARARSDQFALKLGQAAQDRQRIAREKRWLGCRYQTSVMNRL